MTNAIDPRARELLDFWTRSGPEAWFRKDERFDRDFRERFLAVHELAAQEQLEPWLDAAESALALLLLLDQFPRNAFRDSARMFASDALALRYAEIALARGWDRALTEDLRLFFYLPFEHAESLADQERSLALQRGMPQEKWAREHHEIILRFGRFPHRNAVLGRQSRPEELQFLREGGFAG